MATLQHQIEKILKPFEARNAELIARRKYCGTLRAEAEALRNEADTARREFAEAIPSSEYEQAVKAVAAGSRDVRTLHVYGRAGEVEQLERKSLMAADAAGVVLEEVTEAERELAGEVALALRPIWQQLTGELWNTLQGLTLALENIGLASDAVNAANIRGVTCPIYPGLFLPMRTDQPNSATRWFEANETLGLVKPGLSSKAA